jgi:hypothetical protein
VLAASALGGALIGFGLLGVFALYGVLPLIGGSAVVILSIRYSKQMLWVWLLLAATVAAAATVAVMLWGAEHIWTNPSCSQHPNQLSGRITYWSGASVSWNCVNGQPVITHDSR